MLKSKAHSARLWSLDPHQEVAFKRGWALLLLAFGYDLGLSMYQIEHLPFVSLHATRDLSDSKELSPLLSASFEFQSECSDIYTHYYVLDTCAGSVNSDTASDRKRRRRAGGAAALLGGGVPSDLHRSLWLMARNDFLDNFLLRFLRVADFGPTRFAKAVASMLDWRFNTMNVEELLAQGDAHFYFEGQSPQLVEAFMRNEVFLRGKTRLGAPVVYIRACRHFRSNCPDADYEKLVVLVFEWTRLKFSESQGIDQAFVVFDLTGFTLQNADLHAVRFVIRLFQKRYPDAIKRIFIHKAPRIFSVMWKIIVPWMKPYLREKIVFTLTYEELHKVIPRRYIPHSLGGKDNNVPPYIEPNSYNCQRRKPDGKFNELVVEREAYTIKFVEATVRWITATSSDESRTNLECKLRLARALALNYIALDPYLRSRGIPDRNGEIRGLLY